MFSRFDFEGFFLLVGVSQGGSCPHRAVGAGIPPSGFVQPLHNGVLKIPQCFID